MWNSKLPCLIKLEHKLSEKIIDLISLYDSYLECRNNRWNYMSSIEHSTSELKYFANLSNVYNISQKQAYLRTTIDLDLLDFVDVSNSLKLIAHFFALNSSFLMLHIEARMH